MLDDDIAARIGRLKTIKSAFLLEARSLDHQSLSLFALPFFRRAADIESELARLFESSDRPNDALVSLFSAGSCLVRARQFYSAIPILERVVEKFPEAKEMLAECQGKQDQPLAAEMPPLHALVDLLVKKGLISEGEWTKALQAI